MQKYRKETMSDEQKEKVKMYDRMCAAQSRLEKKIAKETKNEKSRIQKQKSRLLQEIPTSPQKFEKVVNKICKVANTCKIKKGILQKALGSIPKEQPNSTPYSLLQLQSFKNQNCITDHANLVKKLKKIHGSLRKASIACNVNWKTFHRLCKPPMKKNQTS